MKKHAIEKSIHQVNVICHENHVSLIFHCFHFSAVFVFNWIPITFQRVRKFRNII